MGQEHVNQIKKRKNGFDREKDMETASSAGVAEQDMQAAVKSYIDGFCYLPDSRKQQMWNNIRRRQARKLRRPVKKVLSAASVFACIVFVGGIGADAASGGKVVESIQKLCGMEPESAEIIENMTPEAQVYAPPLLECNKERAIFATSRGIVVYSREEKEILAVIDLQAIGCNYFTTDSIETKVTIDGSAIRVFNVKKESARPQGKCYSYDLPAKREKKDEILELEPSVVEEAGDFLAAQWEEKMGKNYRDTFGQISEAAQKWESGKDGEVKYSEQSVEWEESGKKMSACLLLFETEGKSQQYKLYIWEQDTGKSFEEALETDIPKEASKLNSQADGLPEFAYTGKDEIMKAVCDYMQWQSIPDESRQPETVEIPAPIIYGTVKAGSRLKVFGNFWSFTYYKNGNVLENDAGGEMPACIHLKKANGSYQVVKVEKTGDGAEYQKGIEKFCKGRPDIYRKYFDEDNQILREKIRKELIEQYVSDNQLAIKYYHDYGWDPVPLD